MLCSELCVIERFAADFPAAHLSGISLSVAANFSAHENGIFFSSASPSAVHTTSSSPTSGTSLKSLCWEALIPGMAQMALVTIHEFKVVAEHADQVFLQTHHQRVDPVSKITLAPSQPI